MPFHSDIAPHLYGQQAWAAWVAFTVMAGRHVVVRARRRAGTAA